MTIAETLRTLPLFEGFGREGVEQLAARAHTRSFPSGATIVSQGDFDASMFVITSGKARVLLHAPGGTKEVAVLGKGDVAGEISLLTGVARTATVVAVGSVSAIEIDKAAFSAVVAGRKVMIEHIASIVEQRRAELDYVRHEAEQGEISGREALLTRLTRLFG